MGNETDTTAPVVIVAGAGAAGDGIGNGRAAAILTARQGCRVVCVDRQAELGEATATMIEAEGGTAIAIGADVTDADDCARIAATTIDAFGGIDRLVNNVGVGSRGSVVETEPSMWDRVMRINVSSVYHLSRAVIPTIAERGGGAIVNISSISALRPRGLTAYSTSKGAVITLTQAMAVDHGREGIRVNCVVPGPMFTPLAGGDQMDPELRERRRQASLLGAEGTGWDIGHAVAFLLSDDARYITGQSLVVDGGTTLVGPSR